MFCGKQRDWKPYKEQFEALIKNENVALILKFRRLLKSLEGDGLKTIQSIRVVAYCDRFLYATMAQRKEHVNSKKRCFMCGGQHHTKLHEEPMHSSGQIAVTS